MDLQIPHRIQQIQPKLHGLAFGLTLGLGTMFVSGGCPLIGQCTSCGACGARLPILALPFLADGAVMLAGKLINREGAKSQAVE